MIASDIDQYGFIGGPDRPLWVKDIEAPLFDESVCTTEADLGLSSRRHH